MQNTTYLSDVQTTNIRIQVVLATYLSVGPDCTKIEILGDLISRRFLTAVNWTAFWFYKSFLHGYNCISRVVFFRYKVLFLVVRMRDKNQSSNRKNLDPNFGSSSKFLGRFLKYCNKAFWTKSQDID